jgi:hypothetical protein
MLSDAISTVLFDVVAFAVYVEVFEVVAVVVELTELFVV